MAASPEYAHALCGGGGGKRFSQPRLADASLACKEREIPVPMSHEIDLLVEVTQLVMPPNKWWARGRTLNCAALRH